MTPSVCFREDQEKLTLSAGGLPGAPRPGRAPSVVLPRHTPLPTHSGSKQTCGWRSAIQGTLGSFIRCFEKGGNKRLRGRATENHDFLEKSSP
ncbi:PREDICTED: uncharacterized protein LOC108534319 isoform X2 [Rhinopithecus bieti]|uniref:uncharacterized protein LOC108534319 isoform X2 n=1 Tax=Rhinopithecus bieti TaxID=61621 RepID=UPI00083BC859|nr:PREDICTED: uncharacterized protein LOC108534319 isoform X2 [Rhinopithecus bieti]